MTGAKLRVLRSLTGTEHSLPEALNRGRIPRSCASERVLAASTPPEKQESNKVMSLSAFWLIGWV
jgi:hypothetical protein